MSIKDVTHQPSAVRNPTSLMLRETGWTWKTVAQDVMKQFALTTLENISDLAGSQDI